MRAIARLECEIDFIWNPLFQLSFAWILPLEASLQLRHLRISTVTSSASYRCNCSPLARLLTKTALGTQYPVAGITVTPIPLPVRATAS